MQSGIEEMKEKAKHMFQKPESESETSAKPEETPQSSNGDKDSKKVHVDDSSNSATGSDPVPVSSTVLSKTPDPDID